VGGHVNCAMAHVVNCQHVTLDARVYPQAVSCGIYGVQTSMVRGFPLNTLVFRCWYHGGYSFISH
jgi:hypothetical protein